MRFTDLCGADGFGAVGASEAQPVGTARLKSSYPIYVQMFRSLFRIGPATNGFGMAVCARVTLDYNAMPSVSGSDRGQTGASPRHRPPLVIDARNSALLLVLPIFESRSAIAS